jgi:pimeloyl-ACP methyl ester carboxylesterase
VKKPCDRSVAGVLFLAQLLGVLGGVQATSATESSPVEEPPVFREVACDLPRVPPDLLAGFRCGSVNVPWIYGPRANGTFRIHVVVYRNPRRGSQPDPIVLLPGGPGISGSKVAGLVAAVLPTFQTRDLVLIDDRGAGLSDPQVCPGAGRAFALAMAEDLTNTEFMVAVDGLLLECRRALEQSGLRPEAFGTSVTVEDLERVRHALGIERWNLHGVSYGTRVAMSYAARYPQSLRSMVLDSVVDRRPRPLGAVNGYATAISGVIRMCGADPACANAHPGLRETLRHAFERLQQQHLTVPVDPALALPGNRLVLNRADFEWVLFYMLYRRGAYGHIPALLEAVRDGRVGEIAPALEQHLGEAQSGIHSLFTLAAVICQDTRDRNTTPPKAGYQWLELRGVCSKWSDPGPVPRVPRATQVPTLILSGENDPITPPVLAGRAARALGSAVRWIRFPEVGHGVAEQSECARSLMGAFFENPLADLDARCALQPSPIRFD